MTQPAGTWQQPPFAQAQLAWTDASGNANLFAFDCVIDEEWDEGATVTEHPVEVGADVADHVRVQLRKVRLHIWATNEPIDANNWDEATTASVTLDAPAPTWVAGPNTLYIQEWDNPITLRSLGGALAGFAGQAIGSALGGAQTGQLAGDIAALAGLEAAFLALPAKADPAVVQTDAGLQPPPGVTYIAQVQQWPGGAEGTDYVAKTISQLQLLKNTAQAIEVIGSKSFCSPMVIVGFTNVRSKETGSGCDITLELKEVRTVTTQVVPAPIPFLAAGGGAPPTPKGKQDTSDAPPQTQQSVALALSQLGGGLPNILSFLLPPGPTP